MAEIHHLSTRHNDFALPIDAPSAVRIPRPLRDLLASSRHGLHGGCRRAWLAAMAAPGEWVSVRAMEFMDAAAAKRMGTMRLRALGTALDLHMGFRGLAHAAAIGRRVIVVAEPIPNTVIMAAIGLPLCKLVDGPFLGDPAITIMKIIHREGEDVVDVRCRCPSHLVDLTKD